MNNKLLGGVFLLILLGSLIEASNIVNVGAVILRGVDDLYLYLNGNTITFNETLLNATILNLTASTTYLPISVDLVSGTLDGGNLTSIQGLKDDDTYNISEDSGNDPLTVYLNFSNVESFDKLAFRVFYDGGSGHEIQIGLWDYTLNDYEYGHRDLTDMDDFVISVFNVIDSPDHIENGFVNISFYHTSSGVPSHNFFIDYVSLIDGFTTLTTAEHDGLSGRDSSNNHPWALPLDGSKPMSGNLTVTETLFAETVNATTVNATAVVAETVNATTVNATAVFATTVNATTVNTGAVNVDGTVITNNMDIIAGDLDITDNATAGADVFVTFNTADDVRLDFNEDGTLEYRIEYNGGIKKLLINNGTATMHAFTRDGKFGVNTFNPSAEFDLVGDFEITGDIETDGDIIANAGLDLDIGFASDAHEVNFFDYTWGTNRPIVKIDNAGTHDGQLLVYGSLSQSGVTTNDWVALLHDDTNSQIISGSGAIILNPVAAVYIGSDQTVGNSEDLYADEVFTNSGSVGSWDVENDTMFDITKLKNITEKTVNGRKVWDLTGLVKTNEDGIVTQSVLNTFEVEETELVEVIVNNTTTQTQRPTGNMINSTWVNTGELNGYLIGVLKTQQLKIDDLERRLCYKETFCVFNLGIEYVVNKIRNDVNTQTSTSSTSSLTSSTSTSTSSTSSLTSIIKK